MTLGERITEARTSAGLKLTELGKICGVSRAAVSQWESGSTKSIKPDNLLSVSRATGYRLQYLIEGKGQKKVDGQSTAQISLADKENNDFWDLTEAQLRKKPQEQLIAAMARISKVLAEK